MPIINTSAPSPGRLDYSMGLGAPKKEPAITESVTLTQGAAFVQLTQQLPPRCRIVWANIVNQTAVNVTGTIGTITTAGFALLASAAAPGTSSATGATASAIATASTLSSNSVVRATGAVGTGVGFNTSTAGSTLFLIPLGASSNAIQANGTNNFVFGTATSTVTGTSQGGVVSVAIYVEQYDDVVGINY